MSTRDRSRYSESDRKDRVALEASSDEEERTPFTSEKYYSVHKDPVRTLISHYSVLPFGTDLKLVYSLIPTYY